MAERWVLNASPLIAMCRIKHEELLSRLADELVVPQAVAAEIDAGPSDDEARRFLATGRLPIVDTPPPTAGIIAWDLGIGETAVMAHAVANPGWTAILDDGAARKCARSFSVPVKGTLAIVILARQKGLIPSAAVVLRQLQHAGFYLKESLVQQVLQETVKEDW